jgi:hypothetical protein
MRRLSVSLAILAAILVGALWHNAHLTRLAQEISAQVTRAEALAEDGRWSDAADAAEGALRQWSAHDRYLHTTLRHEDVDTIFLSFSELLAYLEHQELDQCAAVTADLVTQLELLAEMEQLTLTNVL